MTPPKRAALPQRWWAAPVVVLLAGLVRYAYWLRLDRPIHGVDSQIYLGMARDLAQGDFSELARLPLHLLYPLTLLPMYLWSLPESQYIQWLHIGLSTLTVFFLYRIGTALRSQNLGLFVGLAAAVYPSFLFWLPYILTEIVFLCCLAAYTCACLSFIARPRPMTAAWSAVACAPFLLSRPTAIPCAVCSWLILAACLASRRWGAVKGLALTTAVATAVVAIGVAAVASSKDVQVRLLSMPTLGQTLWASTKTSTGNLGDLQRLERLDQTLHDRFRGRPEKDEYEFKVREATAFIADHPLEYLGMGARKLAAWWFPWLVTDTWSLFHRVVDAVVTIALSVGFFLSFRTGALPRWQAAALTGMALSFALLSAFGQIDPDARYRLPAELLVLVMAVAGFTARLKP